jgi:hypothetical protein
MLTFLSKNFDLKIFLWGIDYIIIIGWNLFKHFSVIILYLIKKSFGKRNWGDLPKNLTLKIFSLGIDCKTMIGWKLFFFFLTCNFLQNNC